MNRLYMFFVLELYCICNVLGKRYLIKILVNVIVIDYNFREIIWMKMFF